MWASVGRTIECFLLGASDNDYYVINDPSAERVYSASVGIYSAQSMAIAVVATLIIAGFVGFIVGYRIFIWKSSPLVEYATSSSSSSTSSTGASLYGTHNANRRDLYGGHGVLQQPKLNDSVNLMLSLPDVKNEKNLLTLNNGTLPKDYKAKKVYL